MKRLSTFLVCAAAFAVFQVATAPNAYAAPFVFTSDLASFAVLGGSLVSNASGGATGEATIINGNLGTCCSTTSITGFPPGIVNGTIEPLNTASAQTDLATALNPATTFVGPVTTVGGGGLDGTTRAPGVYDVASSTTDFTTLTLSGTGTWVFLMSSSLITGDNSTVDVSLVGAGSSVYWIVREAATLASNSDFAGNILAVSTIAFKPGATDLCGRALSEKDVTFAGVGTTIEPDATVVEPNQVGGACGSGNGGNLNGGPEGGGGGTPVPEPGTLALLGTGIFGLVARRRRSARA